MLRHLSIRDFVIVDRLELDFAGGFGALTGETGAGKSILLDALGLVLGGKAELGMVRSAQARAEISAEFDLPANATLEAWLAEQDIPVEDGTLLLRRVIEAAAAEKQARIDSGKDVIVGVNKYKLAKEDAIEILEVDNVKVRESQIARLNDIKKKRDAAQVQQALEAITKIADSGQGNLLDAAVKAIRARATVGEISDAMEKVFGRHRADTQKVTGVYAAAYDSAEGWDKLKKEIADFADLFPLGADLDRPEFENPFGDGLAAEQTVGDQCGQQLAADFWSVVRHVVPLCCEFVFLAQRGMLPAKA